MNIYYIHTYYILYIIYTNYAIYIRYTILITFTNWLETPCVYFRSSILCIENVTVLIPS